MVERLGSQASPPLDGTLFVGYPTLDVHVLAVSQGPQADSQRLPQVAQAPRAQVVQLGLTTISFTPHDLDQVGHEQAGRRQRVVVFGIGDHQDETREQECDHLPREIEHLGVVGVVGDVAEHIAAPR